MTLQYLFAVRGAPEHLRSDNGPEFVAKEIQEWLGRACVRTLFIQKAGPWEKGTSRASMAGSETSCSTGTATTRLLSGKTILATWAASHSGKAVVFGDLNTTPWSPHFGRLLAEGRLVRAHPRWGVVPTWMVDHPWVALPLDHVLVSPEIGVTSVEVGPDLGSDHRPVWADLVVPR